MNQDPCNDSSCKGIDEMSNTIEDILIQRLKTTAFSIQIDESTVVDNKALVLGCVRYFHDNCTSKEDLLFVKLVETERTGS